jgi:hypothetical protein
MFLFELSYLGAVLGVTRLLLDIPRISSIAYILFHILSKEEIKRIYINAESL